MRTGSNIAVFIEGGLVEAVIDLAAPEKEVPYEVIDWDVLENATPEEVREYLHNRSPELIDYIKVNLPNDFARLMAASKGD